jgi:hypothetical protein
MKIVKYTTVEFCTDPNCLCPDRSGSVLYTGTSEADAIRAKRKARYKVVKIVQRSQDV